jgi:dihydropteroate synthase
MIRPTRLKNRRLEIPDLSQNITRHTFKNWCTNQDQETLIMGIVNVTPDSFSDGGQYFSIDSAVIHAMQLIQDGADILDIGGESTRPGASIISVEEELNRILPVINSIRNKDETIPISIDTTKSVVAKRAIEAGADIVNDISGFMNDKNMPSVVGSLGVPVILMHMKGTPDTMQNNPQYDDIIGEISAFFINQINVAKMAGVKTEYIILDPGIGFGKTANHNFILIQKLNEFRKLGYPIMIGPSRKAFLRTTLDLPPDDRKEGTAAVVSSGIINGARIVRVHDVKEMKRVVIITEKIRTAA